jgi:type VI secretion system protein
MTLTLTINGLDRLENGEPARLRLDRHGARIGRSAMLLST